jgi:hypothetical protein
MITDLTNTLQSVLPHRHYHNPHAKLAHVLIVYRDVQKMGRYSHKALGVNAGHRQCLRISLGTKLAKRGAYNPEALAAWIGRRKYGKKKFAKLSHKS